MSGRMIGLVGFGGIAQAVAEKARALGMTTGAYDPFLSADGPAWSGVERYAFHNLLAAADVLGLHVPLTDETRGMLGAPEFERTKPGAILVNTAGGGIIDEPALVKALISGKLGGPRSMSSRKNLSLLRSAQFSKAAQHYSHAPYRRGH